MPRYLRKCSLFIVVVALVGAMLPAAENAFVLGPPALSIGYFNDNLICGYEAAKDGWSVGPDDQFSFDFVAHLRTSTWSLNLDSIGVTSRLYHYRLDLLRLYAAYDFDFPAWSAWAAAGAIAQGDFGGQVMQNLTHEYIMLYPSLYLPYRASAFDAYAAARAEVILLTGFKGDLALKAYADAELYTGTGPDELSAGANAAYLSDRIDAEAEAGLEYHFLLPETLKALMGNGFFAAGLLTFKPSKYVGFSGGFGAFPIGSVDDDPAFKPMAYTMATKFVFLVTMGERSPVLREFMFP
jgi:hypothetical protein